MPDPTDWDPSHLTDLAPEVDQQAARALFARRRARQSIRRRVSLAGAAIASVVLIAAAVTFVGGDDVERVETVPADEPQDPEHTSGAFAVVSVVTDASESPPADLHLVRLGESLESGVLLIGEASYVPIFDRAWQQHGSNSTYHLQGGVFSLDDGRLLVGYALPGPGSDGDWDAERGVLVVDPDSGEVHKAFSDTGPVASGRMEDLKWDDEGDQLVYPVDPVEADRTWPAANRCYQWDPDTPGSGFTEAPCTPDNAAWITRYSERPVGAAWLHEPSGTVFATTFDSDDRTTVWKLPATADHPEKFATGTYLRVFDVSPDGQTVLVSGNTTCDSTRPSPSCPVLLLAIRDDTATEVWKSDEGVVRSAYFDDDDGIVFSVRESTRIRPYPDETYRTTLAKYREHQPLHDGAIEAVIPRTHGLVPLSECPDEIPC